MKKYCFMTLLISSIANFSWANIRHINDDGNKITTVFTSLGIATIIQVSERPNSVVIGDQDAFKVEYLDQAITIKPLRSGAVTNLYIYTDWRRYNVKLVTGSQSRADYVVYLENPKKKPSDKVKSLKWMPFENYQNNDGIKLITQRLGKTRDGVLLVEFEVTAKGKDKFEPKWIWVTQNGKPISIHNLMLSTLELKPDTPIVGVMKILERDIESEHSLRIELRRKKISYLTIPKVSKWK